MQKKKLGQKTNGIYYVSYYEDGARHRVTTGTRDVKIARQFMRELTSTPAASPSPRRTSVQAGGMTMEQLFDRCLRTVWSEVKSKATVRSHAKILSEMIGSTLVADMNYQAVEALKDALFARSYKPGTVHRKLCTVSRALNYATRIVDEKGKPVLAHMIPMPTVKARNSRDRVISDSEEDAIFAAIAARAEINPTRDWKRFGHLIRFLLDTGCRLGEALGLSDADIEEHDVATFVAFRRYHTKNDKPRTLPLTKAVILSLPYLRGASVKGKLFPIKAATVWYMFKSIREDLRSNGIDVSDVVLHTMRHTALTRLARSGRVELSRISDWAGHSSMQVTKDHYLHLMPEDKLSTLSVIEGMNTKSANKASHDGIGVIRQ